jgi:hypothetical protein
VVPELLKLSGPAEWRQAEAACLLYEGDGTAPDRPAQDGRDAVEMEDAR